MKRGDIVIGVILIAIAAWFSWPLLRGGEVSGTAQVTADGELYQIIDLTRDQTIEIRTSHGYNKLRVRDGGIEMIEADCPDQICLGMGLIRRVNEMIICLPHRIIVEVTEQTEEGDELDAVVS